MTITGRNFGEETTDNPVQLFYQAGTANTDCLIETI